MLNNVLCYIVYLIAHITTTQRVQQTLKALSIPFSSLKTKNFFWQNWSMMAFIFYFYINCRTHFFSSINDQIS